MPASNVLSVDWYGDCQDIIFKTNNNISRVEEYPNPKTLLDSNNGQNWNIDDDTVISHGDSVLKISSTDGDEVMETANTKASDNMPLVHNDDVGNLRDETNVSSNNAASEKESKSAKEKKRKKGRFNLFKIGAFAFFALAIKHVFLRVGDRRWSLGYWSVDSEASLTMSVQNNPRF